MKSSKVIIPIFMFLLSCLSFLLTVKFSIIICCICFALYFLNSFINIRTHFLSMLFGFSCFGFLFGGIIFDFDSLINVLDEDIIRYCSILSLSLSCIQLGNIFSNERKIVNDSNVKLEEYRNQNKIVLLFKFTKILFWFSFVFCILEALIRARYMSNYGYVYLYNHPYVMTTGLNGFITDLSLINSISLSIMLSCLPKVRNVKKEFVATFIYGALILLSGARAKLVNSIFLFISYLFITSFSYEGNKINFKKIAKYGLISTVLIFSLASLFLNVVSYRSGSSNHSGYGNSIVELIASEGKTWQILVNTFYIYDRTSFSEHFLFYTMPFVKTISLQFILNKFGIGFFPTQTYTVDYALKSYSYSHFYAYNINPSLYLSGGGLGSSYLAESYMFGKIFGVIFHSFIIGIFFAKVSSNSKKYKLLGNVYILSVLSNIFWSPRASALDVFFSFFSFSNVIVLTCIFVFINMILIKKKEGNK